MFAVERFMKKSSAWFKAVTIDAGTIFNIRAKKDIWQYIEFNSRRGSLKNFRPAFYCRLLHNGKQLYLPDCRPDTVIITNIDLGQPIDKMLI